MNSVFALMLRKPSFIGALLLVVSLTYSSPAFSITFSSNGSGSSVADGSGASATNEEDSPEQISIGLQEAKWTEAGNIRFLFAVTTETNLEPLFVVDTYATNLDLGVDRELLQEVEEPLLKDSFTNYAGEFVWIYRGLVKPDESIIQPGSALDLELVFYVDGLEDPISVHGEVAYLGTLVGDAQTTNGGTLVGDGIFTNSSDATGLSSQNAGAGGCSIDSAASSTSKVYLLIFALMAATLFMFCRRERRGE